MSFQQASGRDGASRIPPADPASPSPPSRHRLDPEPDEVLHARRTARARTRSSSQPDRARSPSEHPVVVDSLQRYWRTNIRIMLVLLVAWAAVSLGCGVLLADVLNQFRIGGFPLGFWFAQQGSILAFVLLILVYALLLNRLDRRHHSEISDIRKNGGRVEN